MIHQNRGVHLSASRDPNDVLGIDVFSNLSNLSDYAGPPLFWVLLNPAGLGVIGNILFAST
jgi:hypothetical protein